MPIPKRRRRRRRAARHIGVGLSFACSTVYLFFPPNCPISHPPKQSAGGVRILKRILDSGAIMLSRPSLVPRLTDRLGGVMRRVGRGCPDGLGGLLRRIGRPVYYDGLGAPCPPVENLAYFAAKMASFREVQRSSCDKLGGHARGGYCDGLGGVADHQNATDWEGPCATRQSMF